MTRGDLCYESTRYITCVIIFLVASLEFSEQSLPDAIFKLLDCKLSGTHLSLGKYRSYEILVLAQGGLDMIEFIDVVQ